MERKTMILAFGHKARQGKDFAVRYIIEARSPFFDVRRYSFADALKAEVYDAAVQAAVETGQPVVEGYRLLANRFNVPFEPDNKHRQLLQVYGTEFRRAQDNDYWVRKVMEKISAEKPTAALVSDMRFPNETEIADYTVRVVRTGFMDESANGQHISERALEGYPFDFTIAVPSGDLHGLRTRAIETFDTALMRFLRESTSGPNEGLDDGGEFGLGAVDGCGIVATGSNPVVEVRQTRIEFVPWVQEVKK